MMWCRILLCFLFVALVLHLTCISTFCAAVERTDAFRESASYGSLVRLLHSVFQPLNTKAESNRNTKSDGRGQRIATDGVFG